MSVGARHGGKDDPKEEETRFLQWTALTQEQISSLLQMTLDEVLGELEAGLGLRHRQSCLREVALLDYYASGFWWAKESGFSPAQVSFSMAVFQMLLDNIRDKGVGFVENGMDLANALNAAIQQGESAPLLHAEQATALLDHITNSLFQHYRLYELLFTIPREQVLIGMERTIEVICDDDIAPLEEGMSADHDIALPISQEQEETNQDESGGEQQTDNREERQREEVMMEKEEDVGEWSIQEVEEVMSELAKEMLGSLQVEFGEKLRLHETSFSAKIGHLKNSASK